MPKIIQFTHPGGEHGPDSPTGNHKSWNRGPHRRKFLQAEGDCITKNGKLITNQELLFWGEWEPDSDVEHLGSQPDKFHPRFLHRPYLPSLIPQTGVAVASCATPVSKGKSCTSSCRVSGTVYQNTDPYVFGDCFKYFNCRQIRNDKASAMARLDVGSIILFGSYGESLKSAFFQLDTVFVVGDHVDYHPANPESLKRHSSISDDFLKASFTPAFPKLGPINLPELKLRFYFGATFENRTADGMYSFAPAKVKGKAADGFPRVPLLNLPHITNQLKQGYNGTSGSDISAAEVLSYWGNIRIISRQHGCVEGVRFSSPPESKR